MTTDLEGSDHRFAALCRWASAAAPVELVVACHDAAPGAAGAGVTMLRVAGCVADVPPYRLVDLACASGGRVVVALDACPSPAPGAVTEVAEVADLTDGRVAVRWEAAEPGAPATVVHEAQPPVNRRFLLRRPTGPDVGVHDPAADDQARLVASLVALGVGATEGASPAIDLAVAGCIACGVCVQACPHDALDLTHAGGVSTLVQLPDRCRGEGACITHCPEQAIHAGDHHSWQAVLAREPLTLARLRTRACGRCGAAVPLDRPGGLCGPCTLRRREPFGWDVPEAVRDRLPEHLRRRLEERPR